MIPAVLVSLGRAFGLRMKKYQSAYGNKVTDEVKDECIGGFNGNYPGLRVQRLVKKKYKRFLKVPAFARVVNRLIMGSAKGHPRMPMYMGVGDHDGTGDDVMVAKDVEALAHQYCRQGVTVQFRGVRRRGPHPGRRSVLPGGDAVPGRAVRRHAVRGQLRTTSAGATRSRR